MPARTPIRGTGIGLRAVHYSHIKQTRPAVPWFEVLIDNYLGKGHIITRHLDDICEDYPITFHGVGMSVGSMDPLDTHYLGLLKQAIDRYTPQLVSDHLCWTGVDATYSHDLLPLPYTEEAVKHVAQRIQQVQDILGQRILIENVSTYMTFADSAMSEAEFVSQVVNLADCDLLLDINNVYVSATNHHFDALDYIRQLPMQRIREFHLAGYEDMQTHLLDTHGQAVHAPVWELYEQTLALTGPRPTLIEWDNDIPAFDVLEAEAHKAQACLDRCHVSAA